MKPLADAHLALGPVSVSGFTAQATASFPTDLAVFRGHFPGQPLVPGVASLALLVATYESATRHSVTIVKVSRSTWKSPALPGDPLVIQITWKTAGQEIELRGSVSHDERSVCAAVMTLRARTD